MTENTSTEAQAPVPSIEHSVVLVHGTQFFGSRPTWTKPGSDLRNQLEQALGDAIAVSTVEWSGRNTHGARAKAAEKLKAQLAENVRRFPNARQSVISHSHGGNAALYALRDLESPNDVKLVTMATPFLVAKKRDFGPEALKYFFAGGLLLCWLAIWLTERTSWHAGLNDVWQVTASIATISVAVCIVGGLAWLWHSRAERLVKDMRLASLPPEHLLILRSPGDEASGILSAFQFIGQLCTRVVSSAIGWERRTAAWIERQSFWKALGVVTGAFVAMVVTCTAGFLVTQEILQYVLFIITGVFLVISSMVAPAIVGFGSINAFLLALLAGALLYPVGVMMWFLLLPFGWRIANANILLEVTVETTPIGEWKTNLCEPPLLADTGKVAPPLAHSAVYENEKALKLITNFLGGK
jgi:hypothetical protein